MSGPHYQPPWIPKSLCQVGIMKIDWWDKSWKSESFKGASGLLWRGRRGISIADSGRRWNLGPSLWSGEQETVYGIPPQKITSAKEIQNQRLSWESYMDCILEHWRCCTQWLLGKRCYGELRKVYWNHTHTSNTAPRGRRQKLMISSFNKSMPCRT